MGSGGLDLVHGVEIPVIGGDDIVVVVVIAAVGTAIGGAVVNCIHHTTTRVKETAFRIMLLQE